MIFKKCRIEDKNTKTINVYGRLFFNDIFPEKELKEFLDELEIIWNKNEPCNTGIGCMVDDDYNWFYTKIIPYFLEDNDGVDKEITDGNPMECKSSIILLCSVQILLCRASLT